MIVFYIFLFALAGFTLKIADEYGEKGKKNLIGYIAALASATFFWLLLNGDPYFSTVILAVVIGSAISLKVNRLNLIVGLAYLSVLSVIFGFKPPILLFLGIFSAIAFLDELVHDRKAEKGRIQLFFRYRGLLKASVVLFAVLQWITPLSAVGLLTFDLCYELSGKLLEKPRLHRISELHPLRVKQLFGFLIRKNQQGNAL
ncbi:MAG: hypothetical protein ABIH76_02530 [Candidatus Bathyarchaeota archaeon]